MAAFHTIPPSSVVYSRHIPSIPPRPATHSALRPPTSHTTNLSKPNIRFPIPSPSPSLHHANQGPASVASEGPPVLTMLPVVPHLLGAYCPVNPSAKRELCPKPLRPPQPIRTRPKSNNPDGSVAMHQHALPREPHPSRCPLKHDTKQLLQRQPIERSKSSSAVEHKAQVPQATGSRSEGAFRRFQLLQSSGTLDEDRV